MELTYRAFGLTIGSELRLPGPAPSRGKPDIQIRRAHLPDWRGEATICYGDRCRIHGQRWWVQFKALPFTALITDGKVIEFEAEAVRDNVSSLHVLGSCTGALLFQRGLMPLHGNTVADAKGSAVTIAGRVGAGKSATTLALIRRGYRLVADDISAVSFESDNPIVVPGFPRLKLWQATLDHFGRNTSDLMRLRPELDKFHYPVDDRFCAEPQNLRAIYILQPAESRGVHIHALSGVAKLDALRAHFYKIHFRDAVRNWPALLGKICRLADTVSVNIVERPQNGSTIEAVADAIDKHLSHLSDGVPVRGSGISRKAASVA
jgi:hypothetical protein